MSKENAETARRVMDAFNRRDLDAFTASTTSDIEWFPALERGFDGGGYLGSEGVTSYFANLRATWEEQCFRAGESRGLGEQVLVLGRMEGRGSGSGVPDDSQMGIVFEFRGSLICRARSFLDRPEALRAVRLEE
jgi:ketosteroid isomerase-like protein